jgi:fumarate hydratase class I
MTGFHSHLTAASTQSIADALQYISYYCPVDYIRNLIATYEREESNSVKYVIAQFWLSRACVGSGELAIC